MRSQIIYAGNFRFPEGDAAAARVLGIGKALREIGYKVNFIGGEEKGRPEDYNANGAYVYQGFPYVSTGEIRTQPTSPLKRLSGYLSMGQKTLNYIQTLDPSFMDVIILYNPLVGPHLRIQRFCHQHRIRLVVDCTEWHDPAHYPGGRWGLHRWNVELTMRYLNRRAGNVIAISSYLAQFYREHGVHTIRVPPLVDLCDTKWILQRNRSWNGSPLRLIYAGSPGKKELLGQIIGAVNTVRQEGKNVILELVGPTVAEVRTCLGDQSGILNDAGDRIRFHGRVSLSQVPSLLMAAHYAVLLRPAERFAQAGFPTKIVEALAAGLPVITNVTSDIAQYVHDGVEGFLVEGCSTEAFTQGIRRALATDPVKFQEMSAACRKQAETSFDYRNYISYLREFFSQLRHC